MTYQYKTTTFPFPDQPREPATRFPQIPAGPLPVSSPELDAHLNAQAAEGWELVSVQPQFRNHRELQTESLSGMLSGNRFNTSYHYPVQVGFLFFWRRGEVDKPF